MAGEPGAELVGVADGPDAADAVAGAGVGEVEREDGHHDAVLLDDQAGLAVDGAFEERGGADDAVGDLDPGAGDQGWWDDGAAKLTSWGFDLGGIRVPVKVWHGRQDRFVPVQHGQWLAASVPGAEADISDRDGHLTMIGRIGEIHDWLLGRF